MDAGLVNTADILATNTVPTVMSTTNGFVKLTITPVALGVAAVQTVETNDVEFTLMEHCPEIAEGFTLISPGM